MVVVYIIIFLVLLSILIIVHEAGHLAMAKAFHVYCFDFSIGFGPKIFHYRRKNGETYFSLRCIPLGGYVSMFGEDDDEESSKKNKDEKKSKGTEASIAMKAMQASLNASEAALPAPETPPIVESPPVDEQSPEQQQPDQTGKKKETWKEKRERMQAEEEAFYATLDPARSVSAINRGKQAVVYVAGIVMNMLLALVLFFVYEVFFPQKALSLDTMVIEEGSLAAQEGLRDDDIMEFTDAFSMRIKGDKSNFYVMDVHASLSYSDEFNDDTPVYAGLLLPSAIAVDALSYDDYFTCYYVSEYDLADYDTIEATGYDIYGNEYVVYFTDVLDTVDEGHIINSVSFDAGVYNDDDIERNENGNILSLPDPVSHSFTLNTELDEKKDTYSFESLGISMAITEYSQTFGEAVKGTFVDFGQSCTTVVRAIGRLFTGAGWSNIGGVIAIYGQTTTVLTEYGFGFFLYTWGMISVNLALLNIIPIPGLDGWQLLVCGVEAATRRKIPSKFKTVMSWIGYIIIIGLFVAILALDIIRLI